MEPKEEEEKEGKELRGLSESESISEGGKILDILKS